MRQERATARGSRSQWMTRAPGKSSAMRPMWRWLARFLSTRSVALRSVRESLLRAARATRVRVSALASSRQSGKGAGLARVAGSDAARSGS
jgi:hypothetical protein